MKKKGRSLRYDASLILRLGAELRREVEALARRDRRLLSDYVRLALEEHVARLKKGGSRR